MTARLYQFAGNKEAVPDSSERNFNAEQVLPNLTADKLEALFSRLSLEDKMLILRHKIVPVACLPDLTLYAAAGEESVRQARENGKRIVAKMTAQDLRLVIRRKLGPEILAKAVHHLKMRRAEYSAFRRITKLQGFWIGVFLVWAATAWALFDPFYFYAGLSFLCGIFFLSVIALRLLCLLSYNKHNPPPHLPLQDIDLPVYSVLVPVFRETQVLSQLVQSLSRLNYPKFKLDIKLILEETDIPMQRAVAALELPEFFDIIVVPAGLPQTKPRALNYALQFARGQLLTIYDAEDMPEPMQLRKASAQFANSPHELACLQAELAFYNPNENWLTRQFTVEYATLFKLILPGLASQRLPILLGGTSNHFRISILRELGAWDPFNVTEDADLGLRLARAGYGTAALDSITYEEANPVFGNWLQQRSRWLKGFLQTWLVHMRSPVLLGQEIGFDGFWAMQAMTFGLIVSALFHPFLLGHAAYVILSGTLALQAVNLPMAILAGLNIAVLFAGYAFSIYAGYYALRRKQIKGWWFVLATMPCYWMLMSLAGWMALWQFIFNPFHWNKTTHGLSRFQKTPSL